MELPKHERETIILFNEEEQKAEVYTHNRALKSKLDRYCKDHPAEFSLVSKGNGAATYSVPKRLVSIRAPRAKKEMTEAQRKDIAERLRKGREPAPKFARRNNNAR